MALRRTAIQGGPNPDPDLQSFTVQNTGDTILGYSITYDADWLYVSPVAGTLDNIKMAALLFPDNHNRKRNHLFDR